MRPIDANNFWKGLKETSTIWKNPTTSYKNVLICPCPNSMPTFLGVFLEIRRILPPEVHSYGKGHFLLGLSWKGWLD
jgi:hypothetical protein